MAQKDVIQRRYLQLYLSRLKRRLSLSHKRSVIELVQQWVRNQPMRAKRKGGVGK